MFFHLWHIALIQAKNLLEAKISCIGLTRVRMLAEKMSMFQASLLKQMGCSERIVLFFSRLKLFQNDQ